MPSVLWFCTAVVSTLSSAPRVQAVCVRTGCTLSLYNLELL